MRFYLTGRLTLEGADRVDQADLPGRQGRVALAYLVLERHRPVPAHELVTAIWDDDPPRSVDASLRAIVSKLRGVLERAAGAEPVAVEVDGGCYQLRAGGAWVDLETAATEVDRAEGRWRAGDGTAAWSHATVAAGIARRPLLPGEDLPWLAAARGRLRGVHVRALSVLTEVHRERGDHGLAVSLARDLVELEPFREAGHRALMSAHLAAGDRAEAVRAYERCRSLLSEELGVDPSPETETVYLAALREGQGAVTDH